MTSDAAEKAQALSRAIAEMGNPAPVMTPRDIPTWGATVAWGGKSLVPAEKGWLISGPTHTSTTEVQQQHIYTVSMDVNVPPRDVIAISDRAMNSLLEVGYVQLVKEKQRYIISYPRELYVRAKHMSAARPGNRVLLQARHHGTSRIDLVASGGREDEEIYEGPPPILPAKKLT